MTKITYLCHQTRWWCIIWNAQDFVPYRKHFHCPLGEGVAVTFNTCGYGKALRDYNIISRGSKLIISFCNALRLSLLLLITRDPRQQLLKFSSEFSSPFCMLAYIILIWSHYHHLGWWKIHLYTCIIHGQMGFYTSRYVWRRTRSVQYRISQLHNNHGLDYPGWMDRSLNRI